MARFGLHAPSSLIWGRGGISVPFYFVQDCSFVKSRILRPLQRHFLLLQKIFFILVCIHAGNPRVPPRVLAPRGQNPAGAKRKIALMYACHSKTEKTTGTPWTQQESHWSIKPIKWVLSFIGQQVSRRQETRKKPWATKKTKNNGFPKGKLVRK